MKLTENQVKAIKLQAEILTKAAIRNGATPTFEADIYKTIERALTNEMTLQIIEEEYASYAISQNPNKWKEDKIAKLVKPKDVSESIH